MINITPEVINVVFQENGVLFNVTDPSDRSQVYIFKENGKVKVDSDWLSEEEAINAISRYLQEIIK